MVDQIDDRLDRLFLRFPFMTPTVMVDQEEPFGNAAVIEIDLLGQLIETAFTNRPGQFSPGRDLSDKIKGRPA